MGLESGAQMTQNIHFAAVVSAIYGNTPIFSTIRRKMRSRWTRGAQGKGYGIRERTEFQFSIPGLIEYNREVNLP